MRLNLTKQIYGLQYYSKLNTAIKQKLSVEKKKNKKQSFIEKTLLTVMENCRTYRIINFRFDE